MTSKLALSRQSFILFINTVGSDGPEFTVRIKELLLFHILQCKDRKNSRSGIVCGGNIFRPYGAWGRVRYSWGRRAMPCAVISQAFGLPRICIVSPPYFSIDPSGGQGLLSVGRTTPPDAKASASHFCRRAVLGIFSSPVRFARKGYAPPQEGNHQRQYFVKGFSFSRRLESLRTVCWAEARGNEGGSFSVG